MTKEQPEQGEQDPVLHTGGVRRETLTRVLEERG